MSRVYFLPHVYNYMLTTCSTTLRWHKCFQLRGYKRGHSDLWFQWEL